MTLLRPTPPHLLVDERQRPYFLWDLDMTIDEFRQRLADPDRLVRAYFLGKLMRQAKPDDVFEFVSTGELADLWQDVQPYLGRTRDFWHWLVGVWRLV